LKSIIEKQTVTIRLMENEKDKNESILRGMEDRTIDMENNRKKIEL
jgi:hypothetical protein